MVQKKKKLKKKKVVQAGPGTPQGIVTSIMVSLPLFFCFAIRDSLNNSLSISSAFAALAFVLQGLSLAFFWRRMTSPMLHFIGRFYILSLWAYLALQAVAPMVMLPMTLIHISGLAAVAVIGVSLLVAWMSQRDQPPQVMTASIAGIILVGVSNVHMLTGESHYSMRDIELSAKNFEESKDEPGVIRADDMDTITANDVKPSEPYNYDKAKTMKQDPELSKLAMQELPKITKVPPLKVAVASPVKPRLRKAKHKQSWGYKGKSGPKYWAKTKAYRTCGKGREQSPIDIPANWDVYDHILLFNKPMKYSMQDNGKFLQMKFPHGIHNQIVNKLYKLKHIDIHTPSEHIYDKKKFPMEFQMVHENKRGKTAIVSALVMEGAENQEADKIVNYLPTGKRGRIKPRDIRFDIKKLLPNDLKSFQYYGSLTHPPCTEGVLWNVLNNPIEMSKDQILKIKRRYKRNARPIQALYHRK